MPEQLVNKLPESERTTAAGRTVAEASRKIRGTEAHLG